MSLLDINPQDLADYPEEELEAMFAQLQKAKELKAEKALKDLKDRVRAVFIEIEKLKDGDANQALKFIAACRGINLDMDEIAIKPKKKLVRLSDAQVKEVITQLKAGDKTVAVIAEEFGVSAAKINQIKKEAGLVKPKKS